MKFATVLMSLMFAGVFAQAQGSASEAAAGTSEVKQEVKTEKEVKVSKAKKEHKHGKKSDKAAETTKQ